LHSFIYLRVVVTVTATEIDANHPPIVRSIYFLSSVNLVGGWGNNCSMLATNCVLNDS